RSALPRSWATSSTTHATRRPTPSPTTASTTTSPASRPSSASPAGSSKPEPHTGHKHPPPVPLRWRHRMSATPAPRLKAESLTVRTLAGFDETVRVLGSKSYTNRYLAIASLSGQAPAPEHDLLPPEP